MTDPMDVPLTQEFMDAWPTIQRSGDLHGWMGIGWAAWQAARATPADQDAPILTRDFLGELVRDAWIKWATQQPNPKPSWLVPYWDLNEADKEADRQIGEAVWNWAIKVKGAMLERGAPADQEPVAHVSQDDLDNLLDGFQIRVTKAGSNRRNIPLYAQPPQKDADHIEAQSVRDVG